MTQELTRLTLAAALAGLERKDFSALELTEAHLRAMEQRRALNAFITETPERARAQARESDARRARGEALPLDGIPLAIKDLFCTQGVRTTAASKILANFIPPYESTVTAQLWRDGAVMLGKANLDEFAMGSANITSAFGPVINPCGPQPGPCGPEPGGAAAPLVPGGSSGGSAAAVAAGLALGATGTDTGGSIRQPASFCGIVGVKPTYGRCSRRGIVAFASSLDQAGPMARTVRDAALLLNSMAGFDPGDSTSVERPVPDYTQALGRDLKGLRVGIPAEYRLDGMPADIDRLWDRGAAWLTAAGAEIVPVSLPHTRHALATYYIIAPAEASSNLARYDGVRYGLRESGGSLNELYAATRAAGFGDEVRRRILMGTYVLSAGYYDAYYLKAQKVRTRIADDFAAAFKTCDLLLTPTTPSAAFAIGEKQDDPLQMYLNDIFTVPASLAGLPALSVPAGHDATGLPLGLHLIARPFAEETLLQAAQVLETESA